ncbi:MAG: hypothetical protein QM655_08010 [Nocardioidaceae bacterium]
MSALVLDSQAVNLLIDAGMKGSRNRLHPGAELIAALVSAQRRQAKVIVPAAVLSELYRDRHAAGVDTYLRQNTQVEVHDTDRPLAKRVGAILASHDAGSELHMDACVVASAELASRDGAIIMTSDIADLRRLSSDSPGVKVAPV